MTVAPLLLALAVSLGPQTGGGALGSQVQRLPPAAWPHDIALLAAGAGPGFSWCSVLKGKPFLKEMRGWRGQEGCISEPRRQGGGGESVREMPALQGRG